MEQNIPFRREQFTFYRSFYEAIQCLPAEDQLAVYLAMIRYALNGEEPEELSQNQMGYFRLIRPNLKTSRQRASAAAAKKEFVTTSCRNKKENEKENENELKNKTESKGFNAFWERYPLALGRSEAEAAWVSVTNNTEEQVILQGLERWCRSKTWERENGRFIPKPAKFLEEGWFQQEPREIPSGPSGQLGRAEMEALQRMMEDKL